MEEEELHQQLNERIRYVFDNYEDPAADDGWLALREKFPAKAKERSMAWLWYAAAAVVLLGIGLWFVKPNDEAKRQVAQNTSALTKHDHKAVEAPDTVAGSVAKVESAEVKQANANRKRNVMPGQLPGNIAARKPTQVVAATAHTAKDPVSAPKNVSDVKAVPPSAKPQIPDEQFVAADQPKQDINGISPLTNNGSTVAANKPESRAEAATKPIIANSAEAMAKLLAQEDPLWDNKKKNSNTDKKVVLGLYAGTFFNYADGSDNRMNVGAGISSDVSLSRHLKLSTGVSIAQNSLKYNYDNYNKSDAYAASLDIGLNAMYADAVMRYSTPVASSYRASLIGIDIPLNIKYQFNTKTNDTYILAGVSSGTFLNETYTTDYNVGNATQQRSTQAQFSEFYIAKTLNVSFGIGYPFGKNRLVVEPFLKYPLGGLGVEQIKFGSGGINLRFNFSGVKK